MLYPRLQLAVPEGREFLVAPPRSSIDAFPVAAGLASDIAVTGCSVRLIRFTDSLSPGEDKVTADGVMRTHQQQQDERGQIETVQLGETGLGRIELLRSTLSPYHGLTVVAARGLLDSPVALLTASIVDAVIVVVQRGRTGRADLDRVRRDVERAGGRIAGSVLVR